MSTFSLATTVNMFAAVLVHSVDGGTLNEEQLM